MNAARLRQFTARYPRLRIAVVGDYCLDRYLEIDPTLAETSIETGLPVHNVVRVRSQPGGAGTILNNLAALGIGTILPIGFSGDDGEGFELRRALAALPGVDARYFLTTADRSTFTYCKPLLVEPKCEPRELNRLDTKNRTPTPAPVEAALVQALDAVSDSVDAVILLDQVDRPETGVVTAAVRTAAGALQRRRPELLVIADSRRGLGDFPPTAFKMNVAELNRMQAGDRAADDPSIDAVAGAAAGLARRTGRAVFVTLAERGIVGVLPTAPPEAAPAYPTRGPIDIVGAGDAVTANLTASLAAGATLGEALRTAMAAASIVVHQLGTTGTAEVAQIESLLPSETPNR